jgi:hypothetical protein
LYLYVTYALDTLHSHCLVFYPKQKKLHFTAKNCVSHARCPHDNFYWSVYMWELLCIFALNYKQNFVYGIKRKISA